MNTVIKGTKTIAEPVKAWFDFEGNFCIEYESGKWWHYNDKGEWW